MLSQRLMNLLLLRDIIEVKILFYLFFGSKYSSYFKEKKMRITSIAEDNAFYSDPKTLVDLIVSTISSHSPSESQSQILQNVKELLVKSTSLVNKRILEQSKESDTATDDLGEEVLTLEDIQCMEPRGRFHFKLTSNFLSLIGKQFNTSVAINNIECLIGIPSHVTAKKEGEDFFIVRFKTEIKMNSKPIKGYLLNLSRNPVKLIPCSTGLSRNTRSYGVYLV